MLLNASVLNAEAINAPSGAARTFLRAATGLDAQAERRLGILSATLVGQSGLSAVSTVAGTIKADLFSRSLIFAFPTYALALVKADIRPQTEIFATLTPLIKGTAVLSAFSGLEAEFTHWPVVTLAAETSAEGKGGYIIGTLRSVLAGEGGVEIRTGGRVMGSAALTLGTGAAIQAVSKLSGKARPATSLSLDARANFKIVVHPALVAQAGVNAKPSALWNSPAALAQASGTLSGAPIALLDAEAGLTIPSGITAIPAALWDGASSLQEAASATFLTATVKDSLGTNLSTRAILVVFSGIQFFGEQTTIYLEQDATEIPYLPDETVIYFTEDATTVYFQ